MGKTMTWQPLADRDVQVSKSQDFEACASYAAIHIIEMLFVRKYGYFIELSERALAKTSDTQPWGNTLENVESALNAHGVNLASDWPNLTYAGNYQDINWAAYYAPIPLGVLKRAYRLSVKAVKLNPSQVTQTLALTPIWTVIRVSSGQQHCVAQISETQFFDSYEIQVKNFADGYPIVGQYNLNIKFINMPNAEFVQKAGSGEFGFYLPALSEDALKDKAMNFGVNILKPDGTIDYTIAKQVAGL